MNDFQNKLELVIEEELTSICSGRESMLNYLAQHSSTDYSHLADAQLTQLVKDELVEVAEESIRKFDS